jgi:predicted cupin superfamily sugar epimerase
MVPTHPVARALVAQLDLSPHPEGGWYREFFRSSHQVQRLTAGGDAVDTRTALTAIHFLLADGGMSRFHRVMSDEVWHFAEGDALELLWITETLDTMCVERLGPASTGAAPLAVVPAGCWQAAHTTGDYSLVSCSVGPGFEFADFTMLADDEERASTVLERFPPAAAFIYAPRSDDAASTG